MRKESSIKNIIYAYIGQFIGIIVNFIILLMLHKQYFFCCVKNIFVKKLRDKPSFLLYNKDNKNSPHQRG